MTLKYAFGQFMFGFVYATSLVNKLFFFNKTKT